nr:hypothetical protein [Halorarius litoreus]
MDADSDFVGVLVGGERQQFVGRIPVPDELVSLHVQVGEGRLQRPHRLLSGLYVLGRVGALVEHVDDEHLVVVGRPVREVRGDSFTVRFGLHADDEPCPEQTPNPGQQNGSFARERDSRWLTRFDGERFQRLVMSQTEAARA